MNFRLLSIYSIHLKAKCENDRQWMKSFFVFLDVSRLITKFLNVIKTSCGRISRWWWEKATVPFFLWIHSYRIVHCSLKSFLASLLAFNFSSFFWRNEKLWHWHCRWAKPFSLRKNILKKINSREENLLCCFHYENVT